ncbi:flagellar basal-body rod protein FlgF [Endothiovibrio diazotrophicus]
MDRMLYVAMSGASQTMLAQAANTNNLANASTTGFRADFEQFRSMPVFGEGYGSRVYAMSERPRTDLTGGPLQTTGRQLDMAINGDTGWFAVQTPEGGEAYTRRGDLRVTSSGQLVTGDGYPLLGDDGPLVLPPFDKLDIGDDGTVTIQPLGQGPENLAIVGRVKLVSPDMQQLDKGLDGLMHLPEGQVAQPDASIRLISGAVEGSNVNAVEAMVNMLELARHYEMQVKMMKTADETEQASEKLLQ